MLILIIAAILTIAPIITVVAQADTDNDGISDSKEQELATVYAPYMHFADGEKFYPTDPNYQIQNSQLFMKSGENNVLVLSSPTATSIAQYKTSDYFLNNTIGNGNQIAADYKLNREVFGDKIYAHVTRESGLTVIQYWFFYAYNPGTLNQHQGDWEMVQIVLDSSETPQYAVYSQHNAGQQAVWSDVEKADTTHPLVFVALGSHANYFRSYQGKIGAETDTVGDAYTLSPEALEIIILGEKGTGNHPATQDWLDYGGKWGNWAEVIDEYLGSAGPSGPGQAENAEKWTYPISWGAGTAVVDQTWFSASLLVSYLPVIIVVIILVLAGVKIMKILKRKQQGKLNIMKILRSKAALGVILGAVGVLVYFTALFMPWYIVSGDIQTTYISTAGTTELVLIDGVNGLRINMLQGDQGLTPLFGIGLPLGLLFLGSVILNALDVIGVEKAQKLSRTYIVSGITSLIPLIIIIGFIVAFAGLVNQFAGFVGAGTDIPVQVTQLASAMSSAPFGGSFIDTISGYGSMNISWGLAAGSYLFILSAIIKFAAGIMTRIAQVPEATANTQ
jgi:hypothetical protein